MSSIVILSRFEKALSTLRKIFVDSINALGRSDTDRGALLKLGRAMTSEEHQQYPAITARAQVRLKVRWSQSKRHRSNHRRADWRGATAG
jgi:hypothetical protein